MKLDLKLALTFLESFVFFEVDNLIVIMNGFQKKIQKTPESEIRKALEIKSEYEKEK